MKFQLGSELPYFATRETTLLLNVEVQQHEGQRVIKEMFTITPIARTESYVSDVTGNRYRRVTLAPGDYTIAYEAEVETFPVTAPPDEVGEVPVADLPIEVMSFTLPSRYCPSDELGRFAWRQFGDIRAGHSRVAAICDWIFEHVDYLAGSSSSDTTASDTFTLRAGVCRDFAHLGITFCRALGIPARFISAYAWKLVPQDFHAVFEAYLDGRWYLFDATRLAPSQGLIRIGYGRDAADTAFVTYFGELKSDPKRVWVELLSELLPDPNGAISISAT